MPGPHDDEEGVRDLGHVEGPSYHFGKEIPGCRPLTYL